MTLPRPIIAAAIAVLYAGTASLLAFAFFRRPEPMPWPVVAVAELPVLPLPEAIDDGFRAQVEKCLLPAAGAYGYDLRVTSGFRTAEEQDAVYRQGRTEDGHIVTEVEGGRSLHNFGLAVDLVDRRRGFRIDWERLGRIAAWCGLEQNDEGDQAHFAHRQGLTIEQLAVGYRPAPLALPCAALDARAADAGPLTRDELRDCGAPAF